MADAKHTETRDDATFLQLGELELCTLEAPTPWRKTRAHDADAVAITCGVGAVLIADVYGDDRVRRADIIITAVNERQALLKCEEALKIARQEMVRTGFTDFGVKFIDDALSLLDEARNGK